MNLPNMPILDEQFTVMEVRTAVFKLSDSTASGDTAFSPSFLKALCSDDNRCHLLSKALYQIYSSGLVPVRTG